MNLLQIISKYRMAEVFLLLGSNMGDSQKYLQEARLALQHQIGTLLATSSVYQTAAWGKTNQPDFLNQVLNMETALEPFEVLNRCLGIEQGLGRVREEKWAARTIDIDILFYDSMIVNHENLVIPHPFLHERAFTLIPLVELAPEWVHPVLKKSMTDLLASLGVDLAVKKFLN